MTVRNDDADRLARRLYNLANRAGKQRFDDREREYLHALIDHFNTTAAQWKKEPQCLTQCSTSPAKPRTPDSKVCSPTPDE